MATVTSFLIVLLCGIAGTTLAAYCSGGPSPHAVRNTNPVFKGEPRFVKQVKNGKLFIAGEAQSAFPVVHVWGTPYEMGYAHGLLMKDKARQFMDSVWDFLVDEAYKGINGSVPCWFKSWFIKDIATLGLTAALDLEIRLTKRYTGDYFYEEAQGLADATGVDLMKILRIHMIGELTKGDCSMLGAWGDAVADNGPLLQLRALDWNTDGPFKDYPQVTVYHPNRCKSKHHRHKQDNGVAFANIGWTGWIGSITGFNSKQIAISEIGVSFPDKSFGTESRFGVPFTFLLRDVLQFDRTLNDSLARMKNSRRTCNLILGVGDAKCDEFRAIQYSHSVANFYTDKNMQPATHWHPRINNVVYYGMDWLCPTYDYVMARQLIFNNGKLTAETIMEDIVSIVQTGSLHIAVYDLGNDNVYIANARGTEESGPLNAYDRTFVRLSASSLFSVRKPYTPH
ncbi:hypothetical protein ACF0H5_005791 [Mactra antiquata]